MPKKNIKVDVDDLKASLRQEAEFLRSTLIAAWNGREDRIAPIAERAGLCQQTVRNYIWSRTRNPSLLTFVGIASALGYSVTLIKGNQPVKIKRTEVKAVKKPRAKKTSG